MILDPERFQVILAGFQRTDAETVVQAVSNAQAWDWLNGSMPLFECPDPSIEQAYYFRWWVYRKHLKNTPAGPVISEFHPEVPWAGKYNTINCALGHHLYEGRWLGRQAEFLDSYIRFWLRGGGSPRAYSTWLADAIWNVGLVSGDFSLALELLPGLVANFQAWEAENLHPSGLFWSLDDRDGMEFSISRAGLRPTLNSYLWADACAIARSAALAGQAGLESAFLEKAARLKALILERLWDPRAQFFKTIPLDARDGDVRSWDFDALDPLRNVRELVGYLPWYFGLPDADRALAWRQLQDPGGFQAPFGPTTAERRHPRFMFRHAEHECLWNGPSWPFATSQTLGGMISLLNQPGQAALERADFLNWMKVYARSHARRLAGGQTVPWLDENLDPFSGEWLSRSILERWGWPSEKGGRERGKDYNHSSFNDLVIRGLVGLRPQAGDLCRVDPLLPEGAWAYFCLDGLSYHGRSLAILYDENGSRYGLGAGLRVLVDGRLAASAPGLSGLSFNLSAASA